MSFRPVALFGCELAILFLLHLVAYGCAAPLIEMRSVASVPDKLRCLSDNRPEKDRTHVNINPLSGETVVAADRFRHDPLYVLEKELHEAAAGADIDCKATIDRFEVLHIDPINWKKQFAAGLAAVDWGVADKAYRDAADFGISFLACRVSGETLHGPFEVAHTENYMEFAYVSRTSFSSSTFRGNLAYTALQCIKKARASILGGSAQ